jgi:hypothetical protein
MNREESRFYRAQDQEAKILQSEAELRVWGIKIKHKDARSNYPLFPPTNPSPNTSESTEEAAHEKLTKNSSKKT